MVHPLITTAAEVRFARPVAMEIRNSLREQQVRLREPAAPAAEKIGQFRLILRFDPDGGHAEININWEQVPNEQSRITLSETRADPVFGQPAAHVDWRVRDEEKRTAARTLELCEGYLRSKEAVEFH